jgi:hypothetical protein
MISWDEFISTFDDENILNYLKTLDEEDKRIILIAQDHLESSFSVTRSNGYNEWLKSNLSS